MAAVPSAAGRYAPGPPGPERRTITAALVVGVHALLAWLLLSQRPPLAPADPATMMSVFDVMVPPPAPPTPPPELRPSARTPIVGGLSGRAQRPSPAPRSAGMAASMDATLTSRPSPMPLDLIELGEVERDEGTGGGGTDATTGSGTGVGDGRGDAGGSGSGSDVETGGAAEGRWQTVDWIQEPRPDQWRAVWPAQALRDRRSGTALLICMVPRPGPPRRCFLYAEYPAGAGFGKAALALSRLNTFRIRPVRTPDGRWSKLPIRVPIVFRNTSAPRRPTSTTAVPPARPRP